MGTDERQGDFGLRSVLAPSHSSDALLESSVSADCDRLNKYERLSHSIRRLDEPPRRQPLVGLCCFIAHELARRFPAAAADKKAGQILTAPEGSDRGGRKKKKEKRKKRWSSWLPDPDRRWPVQGF